MKTNEDSLYDVVRLIVMMLNDIKADGDSFQNVSQIMDAARSQSLEAITVDALEYQGVRYQNGVVRRAVVQRKCLLFDDQLRQICSKLAEHEIWHMPLKGSILKDYYPQFYHREMKDLDILCDPGKRAQVKDIMESLGYTVKRYQKAYDDVFIKEPFFNVEMHFSLFGVKPGAEVREYYNNVYDRLIKKSAYELIFSLEDMYIYMILHTYKHYIVSGVGVRYLLDTYFFINRVYGQLDWQYIHRELKSLGVSDYEESQRSLSIKVFSGQSLTEQDCTDLDAYLLYGTHGSKKHAVEIGINHAKGAHPKLGYVSKRLFPTADDLPEAYRFYRKHKIMLPVLWLYRTVKAVFRYPSKVISEIKLIRKT